jgi:hypothetical protein
MFFEKLDLKVDIEKLQYELKTKVFKLGEGIFQGNSVVTLPEHGGFGGWSILSRTGDWKDGWEIGHVTHIKELKDVFYPEGKPNYKVFKYMNLSQPFEHVNPTQACIGEIDTVIKKIDSLGFYPRRARVTVLKAGCIGDYHRDGDANTYIARIHIPIITNEECIHYCEGEKLHMPADGSVYIMWVNKMHQIQNTSKQNRYHIIMDAYDTQHITQNFKYTGNVNSFIEHAKKYREILNSITLTNEEIAYFDKMKQYFIEKYKLLNIKNNSLTKL